MTRIACFVIILCLSLPFQVFALELPKIPATSPLNNVFESLRSISEKLESFILPEDAKQKGIWNWGREVFNDLFSRAARTAGIASKYAKNKGQSLVNAIETKLKEKIKRDAWTSGEIYIGN